LPQLQQLGPVEFAVSAIDMFICMSYVYHVDLKTTCSPSVISGPVQVFLSRRVSGRTGTSVTAQLATRATAASVKERMCCLLLWPVNPKWPARGRSYLEAALAASALAVAAGSANGSALVASAPAETETSSIKGPSARDLTDPALLFADRCIACHGLGVVAPTLPQMSHLTSAEIQSALWQGVMQETVNGLDAGQRVLLAQWISGLNPNKPDRGPGVSRCGPSNSAWHSTPAVDWPGWSGDDTFQRYVEDPTITAERVGRTVLKWSLPLPVAGASQEGVGNPVAIVGGRAFAANSNHWVYSLDTQRGCAYWTFRTEGRVRSNVAIENGLLVVGDLLANVYALDASTGRLLWQRRVDSSPAARITGNVTLHGGLAYIPLSGLEEVWSMRGDVPCCNFSGSVIALDVSTGEEKWKTAMIDQPLRFLGKTPNGINRYGPAGVMVWSGISTDDKRGMVYVTTGNQFTEPRVNESDAVIALDMQTGKKPWVAALAPEQMGGQDIYVMGCEEWVDPRRPECSPVNPKGEGDRDFGAPAALTSLANGTTLLLAGSKDGMFYALDPDNGMVKWKLRVGAGGETGGVEYGFATDDKFAFVPVSDLQVDGTAKGSFSAIDLATGKLVWRVAGATDTCTGKPTLCNNAYLSIPAVAGDAVSATTTACCAPMRAGMENYYGLSTLRASLPARTEQRAEEGRSPPAAPSSPGTASSSCPVGRS
jgi:polyvinyl alcohol dehydrogenase (cytochrome)